MPAIPLGMTCVARAANEAGHRVRVLDLMSAEKVESALSRAVREFDPDLVGVSLRNIDDQNMRSPRLMVEDARETVRIVKGLTKAPVVLGGAGYSIFPQAALEFTGADMGVQGEGESAFLALLQKLKAGEELTGVPGLYLKGKGLVRERGFVKNLDRLRLPGPDLFASGVTEGEDFWFPVQTRRGCPMGCTYCSTGLIEGRAIRKRSPARVVEWIARLNREGFKRFYFVDNTFNLPPSYALQLCNGLEEASLELKWLCIIYPSKLDRELAEAMARSGCVDASVGFESGSERMLEAMNKRFGKAEVRLACEALKEAGIRRMGFLLLGGPGEDEESVLESLEFADSLGLDRVKITIGIRIYPHTMLARKAREEGVISQDDDLLKPRFYMQPGMEEWTRKTVAEWTASRPNWMADV